MAAQDNRKGRQGSYARGSRLGDATGVAIIRYAEWEDAKRGIVSRREFVKLHSYRRKGEKDSVLCSYQGAGARLACVPRDDQKGS